MRRRHGVEVAIPHSEVGVFADFDRPDFLLEEHLARGPDGDSAKCSLHIDGFRGAEGRLSVRAQQRLTRDGGPDPVAGRKRRHAVVGAIGPRHAFRAIRLEWIQSQRALLAEVARVGIAEPPVETRRRFGIAGVEVVLQTGHDVDRMIRRDVGVNDPVSQAFLGILAHCLIVRINDPVDAFVANGVHRHMHAGVVKQADEHAHSVGVRRWIAVIVRVDVFEVLAPRLVHPRGACAAGAIDIQLHAASDEMIVTGRFVGTRRRGTFGNEPLRALDVATALPECKYAHIERAVLLDLAIQFPRLRRNTGILEARHPFGVERFHNLADTAFGFGRRARRHETAHQILRALFHHARRRAIGVAIDRARRRILRAFRDARQLEGETIGNAVMARRLHEIHRMIR